MTTTNGIKLADGLGPLTVPNGSLTLADFANNREIYDSYVTMMTLAKVWDSSRCMMSVTEDQEKKNESS